MNTTKQSRVSMVMIRTMENLAFIDKHKTDEGPYETTQLVNSFLGALAHPWEDLRREFKKMSIKVAVNNGWPLVEKQLPTDVEPRNLDDLIRLMRNGLAHRGIELLPRGDCEIEAIHIVNVDPKCGHRTWGTVLKVEDVRTFLDKFVATARLLSR